MTEDKARAAANAILAVTALGAAYLVVTTPPLRRLAWRLAVTGLTSALPAWVAHEVRQAWAESGQRRI